MLGHGGQGVADASFAQPEYGLPEQVVGSVEVVEQHLVRGAGRPRGAPEREVRQPVGREVVGDAVEVIRR